MALAAIGAVASVSSIATPATQAATNAAQTPKVDFANVLEQASQSGVQADNLASQVATGELPNIQQFTSAAAKAELTVDLVVAIRNRAIDAYQEIMRMSV
jgi:flagellar hook-basal body complex protein FliE